MKYIFTSLAAALGVSASAVLHARADQCCFKLKSNMGKQPIVGQINGQPQFGGNGTSATFCESGGSISLQQNSSASANLPCAINGTTPWQCKAGLTRQCPQFQLEASRLTTRVS
ncbi:MAG: hypothetical protein M1825_003635 [Sarcosagium campestre]|nr:MAG: hypothetical protein M1825_003635 [Sarcosagium campestre]